MTNENQGENEIIMNKENIFRFLITKLAIEQLITKHN